MDKLFNAVLEKTKTAIKMEKNVCFSSDTLQMIDLTIRLYNVISSHQGICTSLFFSPDGKELEQ